MTHALQNKEETVDTTHDASLESFERLLDEPVVPEEPKADEELEDAEETPATLDTATLRQAIADLQACLPEGVSCTLSATIDRDGTISPFEDDPLLSVEIFLQGTRRP